MRDQELVNALRCVSTAGGPIGDCKKCPFYKTEPVPEDLAGKVNLTEWSSCDVDAVGLAAADRIANQITHIAALQQEIEKLRAQNEQLRESAALVTKESAELLERRWIPVEERLPEVWRNDETAELVNYMIYSPDFGVDIGNYHAKAKKWLCMALHGSAWLCLAPSRTGCRCRQARRWNDGCCGVFENIEQNVQL